MASFQDLGCVADSELLAQLHELVRSARLSCVKLLVHLGEFHARKLSREQGYSSMFTYCTEALRMSEAEAYLRIHAAKVARDFPVLLEHLEAGDLNLTSIKLIGTHLTLDNHRDVIGRALGKTKRDIELLVAEIAPKPDVAAAVRRLPDRRQPQPLLAALESSVEPVSASSQPTLVDAPAPGSGAVGAQPAAPAPQLVLQPTPARAATKPLSPGRFKLELTLDQATHDKLSQLRELTRHQNPSGDLVQIIDEAISDLLEKKLKLRCGKTRKVSTPVAKRRCAAKAKPIAAPSPTALPPKAAAEPKAAAAVRSSQRSRYIPREVLRAVHARDEGRCTFISEAGHRCASREFLEVHHEIPFGLGGKHTAQNLRLTCRAHNGLYAERDYGTLFMQRFSPSVHSTGSRNESA